LRLTRPEAQGIALALGRGLFAGERVVGAAEGYVLCEINVSSVSPFPESAIQPLVDATRKALAASAND
jgi:hypothetical protein